MQMKILITGGAGFIGSNLVDHFLTKGFEIVCLDNFSTGKRENLLDAFKSENFKLIEGDIRNYEDCQKAVKDCDYVLHQAALGSVPRSIADPMTSTDVNIGGFVKMLFAAKEAGIKRFVYAASSSTYGDHPGLPKVEHIIGNALSPYAITKYVDELFANNFSDTYGIETIGLRYFNVFGRRQDPNGAYAAVIPLWVKALLIHESPVINGDGSYSRDFTYIDNVIQANELALTTPTELISERKLMYETQAFKDGSYDQLKAINTKNTDNLKNTSLHEVFNIAFGKNTTLIQLFEALQEHLARFDEKILTIQPIFRDFREGDIPHSLASIEKARNLLLYNPKYDATAGFKNACDWYYNQLKMLANKSLT